MIRLEHHTTVKFLARRCWRCNRWWAREDRGSEQDSGGCPYCQNVSINRLELEREKLYRRLSAMRGAITRLQRRLSK